MWKIGNIEIKNKVALAPMAGISNPAYLKIAEEMGCGWAITELISAEAIIRGNQKTFDMLNGIENINMPISIQLFGSNTNSKLYFFNNSSNTSSFFICVFIAII